jgi:hypothetical protein
VHHADSQDKTRLLMSPAGAVLIMGLLWWWFPVTGSRPLWRFLSPGNSASTTPTMRFIISICRAALGDIYNAATCDIIFVTRTEISGFPRHSGTVCSDSISGYAGRGVPRGIRPDNQAWMGQTSSG